MSLRTRLITGLLVLAAVGLVTAGAVTYAEQRSFLLKRVDQQLASAERAVSLQLDEHGANVPGASSHRPPRHPGGRPPPRGRGPGPAPNLDIPAGTFGQRRDPNDRPVGRNVVQTFGQSALPAPRLPAHIAVGKPITVGAVGDSGVRYRVEAFETGDQPGTTIVAIPLREVTQNLHRLLKVEALVIGGVLLALAALAWWLVGLGLRPLDRMGRTAEAIAAGDLSRRVTPATGRTEVGRLGLALNSMLSQIEKAFAERQASEDRLRRFLADASHELRTPLSSIRGYAELFRIGAARGGEEAEAAMRRIEEEARRMGVLVEDLLALARLDEVRARVREPVDLRGVAGDAVDDARAVAPDRAIELDAGEVPVVLGDRDQLRQVIANLMRNALMHTPAGTAIEVRVVGSEDGDALLEVRDHGPGLPPGDPAELFERFWRSRPGRERGPGGAGLGLAIVAAIVDAHGGSVAASDAVGGGASFTIRLPAERPAPLADAAPVS